jgi:hypothetical protein
MDGGAAVNLTAEKEANLAGCVDEGRYIEKIPEGVAIFAVVEEELNGFFTVFDRDAETLGRLVVGIGTLEKTTVAGDNVGSAVAGDGDESVGCEDDRIIGSSANG